MGRFSLIQILDFRLKFLALPAQLLELQISFHTLALALCDLLLGILDLGLKLGPLGIVLSDQLVETVYLRVKLLQLLSTRFVVRFQLLSLLLSALQGVSHLAVLDFQLLILVTHLCQSARFTFLGPFSLEPIVLLLEALPFFLGAPVSFLVLLVFLRQLPQTTIKFIRTGSVPLCDFSLLVKRLARLGVQVT